MLKTLKYFGLEHRIHEMRDYWYDEMIDLDIDENRMKFTDTGGKGVVIPFIQCQKIWHEADILGEGSEEKAPVIGVRDGIGSPRYILLLSDPPTRILFRRNVQQADPGEINPLRDDCFRLVAKIAKVGWIIFDFG